MYKKIFLYSLAFTLFLPELVFGVMTSTNYSIIFDSISTAGGELSTSTSYTLSDTTAEPPASTASSTSYTVYGGFQSAIMGSISISLSTTSLNLGTLSYDGVNSANAVATISSDSSGYVLTISNISGTMPTAVSDGSVTAGSPEYGLSVSGANSAVSGDVAIVNGLVLLSANNLVVNDQSTITFKAAASRAILNGVYSQSMDLVVSAN